MFASPLRAHAGETLHQISTIDALLAGVYDGETSIGQLKERGDFGLGTFNGLDGEMIVLDGVVRQALVNGTVAIVPDSAKTPFAAVVHFDPDRIQPIEHAGSLDELAAVLDSTLPTANIFYAVRIPGRFTRIKARSVPRQSKPYVPLAEAVKNGQAVFKFTNVEGDLVGIRCPEFSKGVNVPGYHWHFISRDGTSGGHVLDCEFDGLTAKIDFISNLELALPETGEYYEAGLGKDRSQELNAVEKGRE